MHHFDVLKEQLKSIPAEGIKIPMRNDNETFHVTPVYEGKHLTGVNVSNLGNMPFLPLEVFVTVIALLETSKQQQAKKGDAMNSRLGEPELDGDSVEGFVAKVIYGYKSGDAVFRRITPISRILQWAGICTSQAGYLTLIN